MWSHRSMNHERNTNISIKPEEWQLTLSQKTETWGENQRDVSVLHESFVVLHPPMESKNDWIGLDWVVLDWIGLDWIWVGLINKSSAWSLEHRLPFSSLPNQFHLPLHHRLLFVQFRQPFQLQRHCCRHLQHIDEDQIAIPNKNVQPMLEDWRNERQVVKKGIEKGRQEIQLAEWVDLYRFVDAIAAEEDVCWLKEIEESNEQHEDEDELRTSIHSINQPHQTIKLSNHQTIKPVCACWYNLSCEANFTKSNHMVAIFLFSTSTMIEELACDGDNDDTDDVNDWDFESWSIV